MGSLSSTIGVETTQKSFKMALTSEELATLIIFQRINNNWAREVHRFESKKKGKKNYVIFRDSNNRKLTSLADLKAEGVEVDESSFIPPSSNDIVSNRVGANKKARREARAWTDQLSGKEKRPTVSEQVSVENKVSDAATEEDLAKEVAAEEVVAEMTAAEADATEEVAADKAASEKLTDETTVVVASEAIAEKLQEVTDVLEDVVAAVEQGAVDLKKLHSFEESAAPEEVSAPEASEVAASGALVEEVAEAEEDSVEEVAVEEATDEESAVKDPTVEEEAVKDVAVEDVSDKEACDEEVVVEEPSVREVVAQVGGEEVVVEKGADVEKVAVEESTVKEVAVKDVNGEEVAVEKVAVEEAAINEEIAVEEVADEEMKAEENPVEKLGDEVNVAETAEDLPSTEFIDDITEKEDIPIDSEEPCQQVEEVTEEPPVVREGDSEAKNETHTKETIPLKEISEKEELMKVTSAEQIVAMKQATEESTTPALA